MLSILRRFSTIYSPLYMYQNVSLWCTINIISTEDLLYFCTIEGYSYITTDVCCCLSTTQTTTVCITVDSTLIQVDCCFPCIGGSVIIKFHWIIATLAGIHTTSCATTIDMTMDSRSARINRRLSVRLSSHIHYHFAIHQCKSAKTTAEDNVFIWVFRITYRTTKQCHRSILLQHTIDVTAAIDSSLY